MARELSPTLKEQQKWGLITFPYVMAHIAHRWGGVIRYEFDEVYDSEGTQYPHAACFAGDGSLNRIRLVPQTTAPPASQVIRPTGAGSVWGIDHQFPDEGEHWDKVADVTPDEDDTFLWEDSSFGHWDTFELSNPATGTESITKVTATVRGRDQGDGAHAAIQTVIRTGGSEYFGGEETLSGSYENYSKEYKNNPKTGNQWTWAEVTALEAGVFLVTNDGKNARCTQVFITIEATPACEYRIDHQRVASPTPESDFTNWTDLGLADVRAAAICAHGAEVMIFFNLHDNWIRYLPSSNNGASFVASVQVVQFPDEKTLIVENMDAGYDDSGDLIVAWMTKPGAPWTWEFNYVKRTASVWGARGGAYTGYSDCLGLSICYGDDWSAVLSVVDDEGNKILLAAPIPFSSVSNAEIISRTSTEPFTYGKPFLRYPDSYRLYALENFTQEEEQHRIWYSQTPPSIDFTDHAWLEPVPLNIEDAYGMCLSVHGSYAWLTSATKVYRALATTQDLDITQRLLEIDIRQYPDIRKGSLKIVLDNTGGWYNTFNRVGDEITVGIGYRTGAGNEYSLTSSFWITKQKLEAPPWYPLRMIFPVGVIGTLVLETEDPWRFLYRLRTRRHLAWEAGNKTVKELLKWFFGRAGLAFDEISSSDAANNFRPAFDVRVGTSYRTAIKNLLKMIPDQVFFREQKVYLRNPTTAEAVDWTYHNLIGTNLLVFRGKYGQSAWDPNRAEVWGDSFMKMAANYPQVQLVRDRLSRVTTPTYPDLTRAGERADAELRKSEILTGEESWMTAPMNCGLEPWDKLQITDLNAGVSNAIRRVIRMRSYWNAKHWSYHQSITLGAD